MVTTSRGAGNTLAMAEYAIAGILYFAKGLDRAVTDRDAGKFDHRAYRPLMIEGKTACVVGAGGIGLDVGRLCAALGMRVVGTRRSTPNPGEPLPIGFSEIGGAADLDRLLPQSDFVVICCQWTPETTRLFNKERFALMKKGGVLVNVARGEIVDEDALADALDQGHLRGIHIPEARVHGFRASAFGRSRNDTLGWRGGTMRPHAAELKALLDQPALQIMPGCGDGMGARLIEEAGFRTGFVSGSSISAMRLAMPDMDLLTFPEMADAVEACIAAAPKVLWLADGDTGYGN